MNYYQKALENYATFNGRASRSEYWYFYLFNLIIGLFLEFIDILMGTAIFAIIYSLAVLIPGIAVGVRRMHDVGKSGWYLLFPIYNLILACTEGIQGENRYGKEDRKDNFRKKKKNLQTKSYQIKKKDKTDNDSDEFEKKRVLLEESLEMNLITDLEFKSKLNILLEKKEEKEKNQIKALEIDELNQKKTVLKKLYDNKMITTDEFSKKSQDIENNITKIRDSEKCFTFILKVKKGELKIKTKSKNSYDIGDSVLLNNEPASDAVYFISSLSDYVTIENGKIQDYP